MTIKKRIATRAEVLAEVEQLFEDIDLELLFVDIKDEEGNRDKLSDEMMEFCRIFYGRYLKPELIKRLQKIQALSGGSQKVQVVTNETDG